MIRITVVDAQPAARTGLLSLLRGEPGFVPVFAAGGVEEAVEGTERHRPELVVLEPRMPDADGLLLCRRLTAAAAAPRVVLYTAAPDPELVLASRIVGADGLVDKAAPAPALFDALRRVARGEPALPPLTPEQLDAAAHRVEPDDLALLAMLADRTPADDVAETLRLDRRRLGRRTERLLGRLRARPTSGAAA